MPRHGGVFTPGFYDLLLADDVADYWPGIGLENGRSGDDDGGIFAVDVAAAHGGHDRVISIC